MLILSLAACRQEQLKEPPAIVPVPVSLEVEKGYFKIDRKTVIFLEDATGEAVSVAEYLSDWLSAVTGFDIPVEKEPTPGKIIHLKSNPDLLQELKEEGYHLTSTKNKILVEAPDPAGLFYGVQTLMQLLPPDVFGRDVVTDAGMKVPAVKIIDYPRYPWRGMHLDVSRHFFPKEFVKKYIDLIAMHKMNIFHWHLTDDNGWRIEIKKYPLLTEVAAWRVDREDKPWGERELQQPGEEATYGGFYTREEIREIVQYAAERHVTVIPEIEMPGHTSEVFAAYPEYSCRGEKLTVQPGSYWPNTDIFCAGKEETFEFLEDIITEVAGLFPSEYIHIGGDEADKTEWKRCPLCQARMKQEGLKSEDELQSYFIRRIEQVLQSNGKKLIGWDEILEGGLAPEATVMSWRGFEGGIEAARMGHDVVMCPTSHCYFDYYQGDPETEPEAIGGYITLKKVYSFRPTPPVLSDAEAKHILGAQGNVWTEYIPTPEHVEYMALPRMTALAEVVWSPEDKLDWNDFRERLAAHFKRLAAMDVNYCEGSFKVSALPHFKEDGYYISLEAEAPGAVIRYTLDGTEPGESSTVCESPIPVNQDAVIRALSFKNGEPKGSATEIAVSYHKALGKHFILAVPPSFKYQGDNAFTIVDGLHGSDYFNDGKWIGIQGDNLDVTIDLGDIVTISHVRASFLHDQKKWILVPGSVAFYFSQDGESYSQFTMDNRDFDLKVEEATVWPAEFEPEEPLMARYVRIKADNQDVLPVWHPSAGGKAWIFADEIVIH